MKRFTAFFQTVVLLWLCMALNSQPASARCMNVSRCWRRKYRRQNVFVTTFISILELNNGVFEVLSTNGNTRLGGDDIDRALLRSLPESGKRKTESEARLLEALVEAKHRLSAEEEISIDIPFFDGAKSFHLDLKREDLETIARPIIEQTRVHCRRSLEAFAAGMSRLAAFSIPCF